MTAIELKRDIMCESKYGEGEMRFDLDAMVAQMRALENLRDNTSPEEDDWSESVRAILNFQREDGSFSFVSDYDIPSDARVFDLDCGSGRDSLAFLKPGFAVGAVDGSAQMVQAASELTGLSVAHALFDDYEPEGPCDGIWACSSLLRVPAQDLAGIIAKYARAIAPGGVFYLSFKLGNRDGMRNGRWFTDLDEPAFRDFIADAPELRIDQINVTRDVRSVRSNEKRPNA